MSELEQDFWISARHWQPEVVAPRVYAPPKEKICLDFYPVRPGKGAAQWEDWHCSRSVLVVYLADYEALLLPYFAEIFPVQDPISGQWQARFDQCFDNWLGRADWERWMALVERDLDERPAAEQDFYQVVLTWLRATLAETDVIVVEGNL